MRRVAGYDFHHIRKKYDVASMWGNIRPRWQLLQQHLETKGPGWYSLAEREERLFTNRSNRPGDDMTDVLRILTMMLMLGTPGVRHMANYGGLLDSMYAQVREEEQFISPQFVVSQQDVSKVRRRKRKQVDDSIAGT